MKFAFEKSISQIDFWTPSNQDLDSNQYAMLRAFADGDKGPLSAFGKIIEDLVASPFFDAGPWGPLFDYALAGVIETGPGDYISKSRICAACPLVYGHVSTTLQILRNGAKAKEDLSTFPMWRQGYTVHIFPYVHKVYGPTDLSDFKVEEATKPVLCNPPWSLVAACMSTEAHMGALAKALRAGPGTALVTSPISATPYLKALLGVDPSLAYEVAEIGIAVSAPAALEVDAPPGLEAENKARTKQFVYVAFGGMPQPSRKDPEDEDGGTLLLVKASRMSHTNSDVQNHLLFQLNPCFTLQPSGINPFLLPCPFCLGIHHQSPITPLSFWRLKPIWMFPKMGAPPNHPSSIHSKPSINWGFPVHGIPQIMNKSASNSSHAQTKAPCAQLRQCQWSTSKEAHGGRRWVAEMENSPSEY